MVADCEDVSVVLLNYNHARFPPGSIEGILKQTVRPSRSLLIVDDASTDGSMEIIGRYARYDPAIKVCNVRPGMASARSTGIWPSAGASMWSWSPRTHLPAAADDRKIDVAARQHPQAGMSSAWHTTFEEVNGQVHANPVPWNCDLPRYYSPEEVVQATKEPTPSHPACIKRDDSNEPAAGGNRCTGTATGSST